MELETLSRDSAPRHHLRRRPAIYVGLVEYHVRPHMCWPGGQHLLLAVNQIADIERRQLKPMPVCDRISRTSFHAIPAEDTSIVIYVVDLGVPLGAADPVLGGVIGGFNVDAVGWARRGAKEAGHALLQPILVALKHVGAAKAGFDASPAKRPLAVGIVLDGGGLEHLHEGDAHPLGDGSDVLKNRHAQLVYRTSGEQSHSGWPRGESFLLNAAQVRTLAPHSTFIGRIFPVSFPPAWRSIE